LTIEVVFSEKLKNIIGAVFAIAVLTIGVYFVITAKKIKPFKLLIMDLE
jgi:uncharacterized protein YoxC